MPAHRRLAAALVLASTATAQLSPKDHLTTASLWHDPLQPWARCVDDAGTAADAVLASAFVGNGEPVLRVAGLFTNDLGGPNPTAWWTQLTYRVLLYPSSAAFAADPFGVAPASGVQSVTVAQPVNLDAAVTVGQRLFSTGLYDWHRLEFDVAGAGLQTTAGAVHLIAVLPTTGPAGGASLGRTLIAMSNGQQGAVGAEVDWFRSNLTGIGPDTLPNLNAPHAHGALRIVLDAPATPLFSIAASPLATIVRIEHSPLFGTLDVGRLQWTIDGLDAWPGVLQGQLPAGVVAAASWLPTPTAFELVLLGDLTAATQRFGGCSLAGACHTTPPTR